MLPVSYLKDCDEMCDGSLKYAILRPPFPNVNSYQLAADGRQSPKLVFHLKPGELS
jgi:hypothetical protein